MHVAEERRTAADAETARPRFQRWRRLRKHPLGVAGLAMLGLVVGFCFLGPLFYHVNPYRDHLHHVLESPNARFWMGTNNLGRDEMARLMWGGQISLAVGFAAAMATMVVGVFLGLVAGFWGGWVDHLLMRLVDLMRSLPPLFLLLFLDSFVQPNPLLLILLIAFVSWHGVSRLVRAEVLSLKERPFIEAATAIGASRVRIMVRHLLPNVIGTVTVAATFQIADAILLVSGLSFLGLGLPPPAPNWGSMLANSMSYLPQNAWWLVYPPGLAILLTVLSVNLVGDALRVVLDSRLIRRWGMDS